MNANVSKTNGVKFFALVAVLAMIFAGAAVIMSDSGVDAKTTTSGGTTYISGDVTATQEFTDGTNVVVDGDLTIPSGMALIISGDAKFTVESGATITIEAGGQLIFQQKESKNPIVTIDGNIVAEGTIDATKYDAAGTEEKPNTNASYYGAIVNNTTNDGKRGVFLNGTISLEKGAELVANTQADNVTVANNDITSVEANTVAEGDVLLGSSASLNVTKKSSNISIIENQVVLLNAGATFTMNGHADNVQIKAYGTGSYYTAGALLLNAYDATVSGIADTVWKADAKNTSELTFSVTTQNTPALRLDPNDKELAEGAADDSRITLKQFILNVDGTLANGDVLQTIAGTSCDLASYNEAVANGDGNDSTEKFNANYFGVDGMKFQILPKVSISGTLTVENESAIIINTYSELLLSGTLDIEYDDKVTDKEGYNAQSAIYGAITITGALNFTYSDDKDNTSNESDVANIVINNAKKYPTSDFPGSEYADSYYNDLTALNKIVVDGGAITVVTADGEAFITDVFGTQHVYGSAYYVEGTGSADDTVYIKDFSTAVTDAVAAEATDIYVYAWGSQNRDNVEDAIANGATVVDSDMSIPDEMVLHIQNAFVVSEDATLTLEEGSSVELYVYDSSSNPDGQKNSAIIYVEGKVVDYDDVMDGLGDVDYYTPGSWDSASGKRPLFKYEVEKLSADEMYVTYTSLKIAIAEAQDGEVINLNGNVEITEDLTIPANVTVIADGEATPAGITVNGATLTVDGVLDMNNTAIVINDDNDDKVMGKIVVNNYIAQVETNNFTNQAIKIPGAYFIGTIGEDYDGVNIIASAAVAGTNSITTNAITLYGKISAGDVAFTQGEDYTSLDIDVIGEVSGDFTLNGTDMSFDMTKATSFTGSVSSPLTAGTATIEFSKASGNTVTIGNVDDGETVTTTMEIAGTLKGTATITTGVVDAAKNFTAAAYVDKIRSVITVGSGATLNVDDGITVAKGEDNSKTNNTEYYPTLVVDGTLAYTNGTLTNNGIIEINGTTTIAKGVTIAGEIDVAGSVTVAEDETLIISKMIVGDAEGATGSVSGAIDFAEGGYIIAYPAADMADAAIEETDGVSDANITAYYINGEVYMTSYAADNVLLSTVLPETIELVGFEDVKFTTNKDTSSWYADETMSEQVLKDDTTDVSEYSALYAKADPSQALVYVSVGSNLSVFVDNVRYSNGAIIALDVGEHAISIQVNPGFSGETSALIGGTAITGETFEITAQMAEDYGGVITGNTTSSDCVVLSVTGNITQDATVVDNGGSSDGMGLTDYLLIILVVLIVIMAIMVAMRLMRS